MHKDEYDGDGASMLVHDGKASIFGVTTIAQIKWAVKNAKEKGAESLTISLDDRGIDNLISHFDLVEIYQKEASEASWERELHESHMEQMRNTNGIDDHGW